MDLYIYKNTYIYIYYICMYIYIGERKVDIDR